MSSRGTHNEGVKQPSVGSCRTFICAKTTSGLYLYISSRNPKRSLFLHDRDNIHNTPIMTRFRFDRFGGVKGRTRGRLLTSSSKPGPQCQCATVAPHCPLRFTGDCKSLDGCRVNPDPQFSIPQNRRWTHPLPLPPPFAP